MGNMSSGALCAFSRCEVKKMEKVKTAWWRYVLATLVFVAIHFLAPGLIALISRFMDLFTPGYLRGSEAESIIWSWLFGYIIAAYINCNIATAITKEKVAFVGVLSFIAAAYSFFVSAWNYVLGVNSLSITISIIAGGITYLVVGVAMFTARKGASEGK